jgi:glycogen debranching enzyme
VPIFALSTNCLYAEAYRLAGLMAAELGEPRDPHWDAMCQRVTAAIRAKFWMAEKRHFRFYLDPWGGCGGRQECLGNAFALLFDLATPEQAPLVVANQPRRSYGPPSVWPEWERYAACGLDPYRCPPNRQDVAAEIHVLRGDPRSAVNYSRFGGVIWPLIQGLWAEAVLRQGRSDLFAQDLRLMAGQFCAAVQSPEIVHPDCGLPYGGIQEGAGRGSISRWVSCYRQTWSATSYLRLVLHGLFGLDCRPESLRFRPCLPEGMESAELLGLPYGQATLDIVLRRSGGHRLDGEALRDPAVTGTLCGAHRVELEMTGSR